MKKTLSMLLLVLFVVGLLVSCNADAVENLFKDKIQQYTVTFNTNGGSEVPSQEVLSGNKVNEPEDPTKGGYTFDGWYKEEACTTPWNFDTDTITANTTLYAKWTLTTVSVTGVSLNLTELTLEVDGSHNLTATVTPENATDKTVNWSSSNESVATVDDSGKVSAVAAGTAIITVTTVDGSKTATCSVTVSPVTYTVTFNTNGGSEVPNQEVLSGNKVNEPVDPIKDGYTFDGWYKEDTYTTEWNFGTDTVTANTTLYAKWTENPPAHIFVTGVSLNKPQLTLSVGSNETLEATVTPENATNKAVSWSSSNESVATVSNGTVTAIATGTAIITVTTTDGSKTATCTVTVKEPTYTVTLNLNGITGTAPEAQTIESGEKVTKPADPTDTVHTFAGWYKTKDPTTGALSNPWDFDNGTVTADITLYAQWTRTLESIYTNSDIPKAVNNTSPDNAWENGDGGKAFIANSEGNATLTLNKKLEPSGARTMSCKKTENFTKIGDDYVFSYGTQYGVFTLHMTEGKFTSVTYNGAGTNYEELTGTYTAQASN